jgi:predicted transcriptional regulator
MRLKRSPGYDGITVEFYKQFWESFKDFIVAVFNYNYDRKELTQSQKLGMQTLSSILSLDRILKYIKI